MALWISETVDRHESLERASARWLRYFLELVCDARLAENDEARHAVICMMADTEIDDLLDLIDDLRAGRR